MAKFVTSNSYGARLQARPLMSTPNMPSLYDRRITVGEKDRRPPASLARARGRTPGSLPDCARMRAAFRFPDTHRHAVTLTPKLSSDAPPTLAAIGANPGSGARSRTVPVAGPKHPPRRHQDLQLRVVELRLEDEPAVEQRHPIDSHTRLGQQRKQQRRNRPASGDRARTASASPPLRYRPRQAIANPPLPADPSRSAPGSERPPARSGAA